MNLDSIADWSRTHYTSDVTPEIDGGEVTLFGWVQEIRDLGGIRFIILQDLGRNNSGYHSQEENSARSPIQIRPSAEEIQLGR